MSMATAVKMRPNHYEVLGLERRAGLDEIARAFALKMSLGAKVLELCTAYETLRDPERRRAYDEALEPKREERAWGIAALRWSGGPYMMSAVANPAPAAVRKPRPEQPAPFIAAPLGEAARTDAPPSRAQELLRRLEEQRRPVSAPAIRATEPPPKTDAELNQLLDEIRAAGRADKNRLRTAESRGFEWNRAAIALGGLVVGVGVLGAMAGLSVAGHEQAVQAQAGVSVALPRAKPVAVADLQRAEAAPVAPPQRDEPAHAVVPRTPLARAAVEQIQPEGAPAAETVAEPSFEQAAVAEAPAVAAGMPLPAAVVSRTIERIGYPCGGVASSTPVEGSAGVFTVTCASGHSYRASPVRGRYHFRRLGSR
jgi:hypothetical protein